MTVPADLLTIARSLQPAGHSRDLRVARGCDHPPSAGICSVSMIAWLSGDQDSELPACVSPTIAALARWRFAARNDSDGQLMQECGAAMAGTAACRLDESRRAWMAADWIIRIFAPAFFRSAGGDLAATHAATLADLPEVKDSGSISAAQPTISAALSAARAAEVQAAWSVARSPGGDAVWAAVRSSARSAMVAGDVVRAAAATVSGSAALNAAAEAARGAACAAAVAAAITAATAAGAGSAAEDAIWAAARGALTQVTEELQVSALDLLGRMIAVGRTPSGLRRRITDHARSRRTDAGGRCRTAKRVHRSTALQSSPGCGDAPSRWASPHPAVGDSSQCCCTGEPERCCC
jgi:hypothetical protein